ncbi:DUF2231 domain-containing protein [Rhizobium sp. TRM96647]|uniref:DUF2231 domain-containing protein n=1 Tax=unclassified Rhizobium TaxID=2613769 RepID=UPI0021E6FE38|nr:MULTISPECIES: DUF2231 domain-containing protein [unclassified Rhizobium]MCV3739304.1 DUF2231 domain-containing protein [Rhizobium sp. TRM96647]MCV3760946.1 DUF2231 domain-containing protein [Rhizobium sp. TRM96650]
MAVYSSSNGFSAAYPLQSFFVPFPLVCFTLALLTDLAFWQSGGNLMWLNFSSWLLFAGLIFGVLGIIAGLLDLARRRTRPLRAGLPATVLYLLILALALVNSLVHASDGWTAVVPYGLVLSAATVLLSVAVAIVSARKYSCLEWRTEQ